MSSIHVVTVTRMSTERQRYMGPVSFSPPSSDDKAATTSNEKDFYGLFQWVYLHLRKPIKTCDFWSKNSIAILYVVIKIQGWLKQLTKK